MFLQRADCNAASSESSCSQESGVFPGFAEGALADGKVVFLNLSGFTDKNKQHSMSVRTLFRGQLGKTVLRRSSQPLMHLFTARSFSLLKTKVLDDEAYYCNSVYVFSR